jgi:hypothetical protein
MDVEILKIPRSNAMLAALDRVIAVAEETDEDAALEEPIREFWDVFFAECEGRNLCERWSPVVVLGLLEGRCSRTNRCPPTVASTTPPRSRRSGK